MGKPELDVCFSFDVGRSMFDVGRSSFSVRAVPGLQNASGGDVD
jgi:hypothetical protein